MMFRSQRSLIDKQVKLMFWLRKNLCMRTAIQNIEITSHLYALNNSYRFLVVLRFEIYLHMYRFFGIQNNALHVLIEYRIKQIQKHTNILALDYTINLLIPSHPPPCAYSDVRHINMEERMRCFIRKKHDLFWASYPRIALFLCDICK